MTAKKAILAVSFGTSHHQTRKDTIEAIEKAIAAACPDRLIRRAFTSGMIIRKLQGEGVSIDDVAAAMDKLIAEGVTDLIVQPTHVMDGFEYEKMRDQVEPFRSRFAQIKLGAPLLDSDEDYAQVVEALAAETKDHEAEDVAIVWMGHGTEHPANSAYGKLERCFRQAGYQRHFIGTVEAEPGLEEVAAAVKACQGIKKVVLLPLMIVAGDHAVNDMAGDEEDSWKTAFEEAGYEVECVLKGMGQYPAIRQIFVRHTKEAQ